MRIYVLGSTSFLHEMVDVTHRMQAMGLDAWIHPQYVAFAAGEDQDQLDRAFNKGEHAAVKRENDYLRQHYQHILESDVILIVNNEKNGISNYIGGNVLIEMGQAHVNDKKIFFLYGIPEGFPYNAEIECMDPICLNGDLENLKNYIVAA